MKLILAFLTSFFLCTWCYTVDEAREFIDSLDSIFSEAANEEMVARWNYITNITTENEETMNEKRLKFQKVKKEATLNISLYDWDSYEDDQLARTAKFYYSWGNNITEEQLQQMNGYETLMESIYSKAKICGFYEDPETCVPSLELEPDLVTIFAESRVHEELAYVWKEWRKVTGEKYRTEYLAFIEINNMAARSLGFPSLKEQWLERYESDDFSKLVMDVWTHVNEEGRSLELFYKHLHSYVRWKLADFYNPQGAEIMTDGYIPAHLLGNMWAQSWEAINNLVRPFDNVTETDVTQAMIDQGYDAKRMFTLAEAFFVGLGFDPMTSTFWEKSMITKPDDRDVVCHASAEDFFKKDDFRIKMCTVVTQTDLETVHHEMGHIEYFMEYEHQPFVYREAANPGFHEAIGDTMSLAVNTPSHLKSIGLLPNDTPEPNETDKIGYLFNMALTKLAFLPFALVMDSWRWKLFTGEIDGSNMNEEWWKLRQNFQGITAPFIRSEIDFDPGAKYHIPTNVPYVRYYVSFLVQFQFYEALCKNSGQYIEGDDEKPLFLCDFSQGGNETGKLIRDMMEPGFSKSWPDALEAMTGSREMSGDSFLKYFKPLYDFLEKENSANHLCIGWGDDCEENGKEY